jgi:hypothetical protein
LDLANMAQHTVIRIKRRKTLSWLGVLWSLFYD